MATTASTQSSALVRNSATVHSRLAWSRELGAPGTSQRNSLVLRSTFLLWSSSAAFLSLSLSLSLQFRFVSLPPLDSSRLVRHDPIDFFSRYKTTILMTDIGPIETPRYDSPNRMHVLANGDIVDCGRLPQTARNNLYKTELCKHYTENGNCRYGSKCQFAHGEDELRGVLRHPKYKTTRCKAYLSTGKCMYGSRCRFIHTRHPGEEDQRFVNYGSSNLSSTASESDDQEPQSKDLLVNPYGNALEPIDLSQPFGGMSLAPLSGLSPPKAEFDSYLSQHPLLNYSFQSSDLGSFGLRSSITSSCSAEGLNAVSPRSASSTESATSKFSRLTIFQRICREDE